MTALAGTFNRYIFKRFVATILAVFAIVFLLIYVIDVVEVFRVYLGSGRLSVSMILLLSVMRTPVVAEQVIPFATLFGALIAFLNLSRRLELAVARASGMSVWQFTLPALAAAFVIGVFTVLAFNPISAQLKSMSDDIVFRIAEKNRPKTEEIWLRQKTDDGNAVIRAYRGATNTPKFSRMTIFSFDPTGRFIERIQAETSELVGSNWQLTNVRVQSPGIETKILDTLSVPTNLTAEQVRQSLTPPETVSFYDLPDWAGRLKAAGLDANRYLQQYKSLLARPFLLTAMILVAASASLRFSRSGASGRAILTGIASGFALYVVNKVTNDLGAIGTFSTSFSAFFPPVLAGMLGILVLLYQEDG